MNNSIHKIQQEKILLHIALLKNHLYVDGIIPSLVAITRETESKYYSHKIKIDNKHHDLVMIIR